jgi:glycosyltransferase involved in cell wall biosynthesis
LELLLTVGDNPTPGARIMLGNRATVLHLIESLAFGGAEITVSRLVAHLRQGAYHPIVCCFRGGPLQAEIEREGVVVITLNISRRSILLLPLFLMDLARAVIKLLLIVRTKNVHIIHAHLVDSVMLGGIVGKLSGARVVATFPGPNLLPVDRKAGDPRNRLRRFVYHTGAKLVHRFVAVSDEVKHILTELVGVSPEKIAVVHSGVDLRKSDQPMRLESVYANLGLSPGEAIVTCVGRLVPNKGQRFLIQATKEVVRYHPQVKFLLLGAGPAKDALTKLVSDLGVEGYVRFLPDWPDTREVLAITTAFVLPSLVEGISVALLEAMAAGKPVIATAIPGNIDVVIPNETGLLVPAQDASALAQAICALLADPGEARRMGAAGRARARNYFSFANTSRRIEELYDEVMACK